MNVLLYQTLEINNCISKDVTVDFLELIHSKDFTIVHKVLYDAAYSISVISSPSTYPLVIDVVATLVIFVFLKQSSHDLALGPVRWLYPHLECFLPRYAHDLIPSPLKSSLVSLFQRKHIQTNIFTTATPFPALLIHLSWYILFTSTIFIIPKHHIF